MIAEIVKKKFFAVRAKKSIILYYNAIFFQILMAKIDAKAYFCVSNLKLKNKYFK